MFKNRVDFLISNTKREQDAIYEKYVTPALEEPDHFEEAYANYVKNLNHFDVAAYQKTVQVILASDDEEIGKFQDMFSAIPDYATARNEWDVKIKDILDMDGTAADKQNMIDALDFKRTRAHNGVIQLFNSMNKFAHDHNIAYPYPNSGLEFDPKSPHDRELVADILTRHEPLLEVSNLLVQEQDIDKVDYRSMTPSELLRNSLGLGHLSELSQALDSLNFTSSEGLTV